MQLLNTLVMRKNLIFSISVCLCLVRTTYAQDYFTVIKVSGSIVIERTGSSLGIGTSFLQNENLLFKIPDSRAAVINPDRGRYLITSENLSVFKNSKTNYLPPAGKISTRALTTTSGIKDLKTHFEGNYLILNELRLKIDTTAYSMNENKFFYITYNYQTRPINKKLAFSYDTLIIKKNELLTVDGKIIPDSLVNEMKLMYLIGGESYTTAALCTFTPVFPDNRVLGQEINLIFDQLNNKSNGEKLNEISAFIKEFYGKFDETNLQRWLFENFGFKQ
jgi:hypothetical protein